MKLIFIFFWFSIVSIKSDYIPPDFEEVTLSTVGSIGAIEKCGEGQGKGLFKCVPYHRCDPYTNTTIPETEDNDENYQDYSLSIDIRFGETKPCPNYMEVCCKINNEINSPTVPSITLPTTNTPTLHNCGIRNKNGIDFKITGNIDNEAEYGEFPWMVALLKNNSTQFCGGSLIAPRVVLTGAHCIVNSEPQEIKVRAGEWDTQTTDERYPYQERTIARIIIHEKFKNGVLFNDVALLILESPFNKAKHIATVCLPDQNEEIQSEECYATGWGKDLFGSKGKYQVILKKIDLPIVPHQKCENILKGTKLMSNFRLHGSFICAGGVPGKDTCTGDGGSPLVCPDPKNPSRYVQAGIVAWGLGCGTTIPGVYANVAKFRNWIDDQMSKINLSNIPYTV